MKLYFALLLVFYSHFTIAQTIAEFQVQSGSIDGADIKLAEFPIYEFFLNSQGDLCLKSKNHTDGKVSYGQIISATYYNSGTSYSYNFIWEVQRANDEPIYWRVVFAFQEGVASPKSCLVGIGKVTEDKLYPLLFECSVKEYYNFRKSIAIELNDNQNRVIRKAKIGVRTAFGDENGELEWQEWVKQKLVYITNAKGNGEVYIFRDILILEDNNTTIYYKKAGTDIKKYRTEDGATYTEWLLSDDSVITLFDDPEKGLFKTINGEFPMIFHYY